jgi:membrane-bound serine protease (ClpP class)
MQRKATEDLAAQARGYAARRGEDAADWAERAVRDAASATADEALDLGLVDAVATSPSELLEALDGQAVTVAGRRATLSAPAARAIDLEPVPMTAGEQVLGLLANPAIALLLITLGVNALLAELSNPGGYVAGLVGVVSLVLGFYSLGALEANLVGLVFIAAAAALFALEVHTPTKGFAGVAGVGLFVLGAVILFSGTPYGIPWVPILALAGASLLFALFALGAIARSMHRRPVTGGEALIGRVVTVRDAIAPRGAVIVDGERWDAVAEAPAAGSPVAVDAGIMRGERVVVVGREGFTLVVRRAP